MNPKVLQDPKMQNINCLLTWIIKINFTLFPKSDDLLGLTLKQDYYRTIYCNKLFLMSYFE